MGQRTTDTPEMQPTQRSTDIEDRSRLAEVMGWQKAAFPPPNSHYKWSDPKDRSRQLARDFLPNPYTDANDDYAVLQWARQEWRGETIAILWKDRPRWLKFKRALTAGHLSWEDGAGYKVGDYARAALKVIDDG